MGTLAILLGLLIVGVVIIGFITYVVVMATLIMIGAIFFFWAFLFGYFFDGNIIFLPCAVVATGLTFWAINAHSEKSDKSKA
jgi:hypothetical protein